MPVSILTDAIVAPAQAAATGESRRFQAYGSAAIAAGALVAAHIAYYWTLDFGWLRSQIMAIVPLDAKAQTAVAALLQPLPFGAIDAVKTLSGFLIFVLFQAGVLSLLLGLALPPGHRLRALPVSAVSQTPRILDAVAILLGLFVIRRSNVTLGDLNFLSFDALFGHLPVTSVWYEVLTSLTLPGLWGVWIVLRWLQARAGLGLPAALAIALTPQLLLYGTITVIAVLV